MIRIYKPSVMLFEETPIKDLRIIHYDPRQDERGLFCRLYCAEEFSRAGITKALNQINFSETRNAGSIRGMHYQIPPYAEIKIVQCLKGSVCDIVIDLRKDSPTFLQHFSYTLTSDEFSALLIPEGFAHGFQTLEEDTKLLYFHSSPYHPGSERGLHHADPALSLHWPLPVINVSEKDQNWKFIDSTFEGIQL